MEIDELETSELIVTYSKIIEQLKKRHVIRTKNLLGDLAEFLVIDHFTKNSKLPNLQSAPAGTKNVDAISRLGDRYSIKATSSNLTGSFWGLNPPGSSLPETQKFEYLIIACFDDNFQLVKILQADWNVFLKNKSWNNTMKCWKISITKKFEESCQIIYSRLEKIK
ncbi:hypothetical protein [Aquirufa novilacunae]|jgi:hypothetical protein|uniref:Uncharacterized protein n=1 Tax=Aquirufa novilacunae TaxID=3139305 RepID=A0ABW8U217_9BACT